MLVIYMSDSLFQLGNFVRTPCIKFVAETASFLTLLVLIVANSFEERGRLCDKTLANDSSVTKIWTSIGPNVTAHFAALEPVCIRNYRPETIQMTICIWICGK